MISPLSMLRKHNVIYGNVAYSAAMKVFETCVVHSPNWINGYAIDGGLRINLRRFQETGTPVCGCPK